MAPMNENTPIDPEPLREPLRAIYAAADADVLASGSACAVSGRCCRFKEYEHVLYLSGVEAAVFLADAPERAVDSDGASSCPWQDARGLCTARDARPLACRTFLCDPKYQEHGPEIMERHLHAIKQLTLAHGLAWGYAPLADHLRRANRFSDRRAEDPGQGV